MTTEATTDDPPWQRWLSTAGEWVRAVERAYVAAAFGQSAALAQSQTATHDPAGEGAAESADADEELIATLAAAAAGAVASRFLAVGTPRSIGLVGDLLPASLSLCAHRVWFQPADIRCAGADARTVAADLGGRVVSLDEALAADIVCVHVPLSLEGAQLRRGTHVNALTAVKLDQELRALATIADEPFDLPALAAGLCDGRQLDEVTVFVVGDLAIARRALTAPR